MTFRYEEDDNEELHGTIRLALQPERCFVTSPVAELDLTLVAVAPTPDGEPPGKTFGHIVAPGPIGKVLLGQPVNILQHPDGRPREIAVRNNLLLSVDDDLTLTYGTDTERGSSGSPVLSDRWELVALHHSSKTETASSAMSGSGSPRSSATSARWSPTQTRSPRPAPTRRRCSVSSSIWGRSKGRGSAVRRGGPT